jgi:hypothetical protein
MLVQIFCNVILLSFFYNLIKNKLITNIKDEVVCFQIYRSIICTIIALYSSFQVITKWDKLLDNPIYYKDSQTENVNVLAISYFTSDIISMVLQRNKRISLWLHHIFCLSTISIHCLYYNNPSILLNLVNIAEFMSIVSGVDAVAKYYEYKKVLYFTRIYRCIIILFVRIPIWFILLYFVIYQDMYFFAKFNCIIGTIIMNSLDYYWLSLCFEYLGIDFNLKR